MTIQSRLDNQHHHLLEIVDAIEQTIAFGAGSASVDLLLDHLTRYVESHFVAEEQFMLAYGFADLERHRTEHERCRERLRTLMATARSDESALPSTLQFLRAWLADHEEQYDREYACLARAEMVNPEPENRWTKNRD
jgi:hemerythrin-like metal-binding protein